MARTSLGSGAADARPEPAPGSDGDATRNAILQSAAQWFRKDGFDRTSTRQIAATAGVNQGLLYYYFRGKEDILFHILLMGIDAVLVPAKEIARRPIPASEKIRRLLANHFKPYEENDSLRTFSLGFTSHGLLEPEHHATYVARRNAYQALFEDTIRQGMEAGDFTTEVDVKMAAFALLGMLNHVVVWFRYGGRLSAPQIADQFATIFLRGLERRGATPELAEG
jgi:AcrR family transcriptional regulator